MSKMLGPNSEPSGRSPILTYFGVGTIVLCAGLLIRFVTINLNHDNWNLDNSKQQAASREAEAKQAAAREAVKALTVDKEDQSPEEVWRVADRNKRTWERKVISTQLGNIRCMVFSPDGRQLAVCGSRQKKDGSLGEVEVQFWDVLNGEKVKVVPKSENGRPGQIIYPPLTRQYLLRFPEADQLCNADSHDVIRTFKHRGGTGGFSPNGKLLAMPSYRKQIEFFTLPEGKDSNIPPLPISELNPFIVFVTSDVLLTHFGKDYAHTKSQTITRRVSDPNWVQPLTCFSVFRLTGIRLSEDRKLVYHCATFGIFGSSLLRGPLQLGDWQADACIRHIHPPDLYVAVLTPDKKNVITAQNDGSINFWSVDTGEKWHSFRPISRGHFDQIDITRDGAVLAVSAYSKTGDIYLYDVQSVMKAEPAKCEFEN